MNTETNNLEQRLRDMGFTRATPQTPLTLARSLRQLHHGKFGRYRGKPQYDNMALGTRGA